jgi:ASCH domain
MPIYTASYFQPQNHHGAIVSISRSHPKHIQVSDRLPFFAPSQSLLSDKPNPAEYTNRFREEIRDRMPQIRVWLESLTPDQTLTLCCWEPAGQFCHRNLVAALIEHYRPDCFGGCDVEAIAPAPAVETISCTTLWEPWASLLVWGLKKSETRSGNVHWAKKFKGDLLIHAAKRPIDPDGWRLLEWLHNFEYLPKMPIAEDFRCGCIIGKVQVTGSQIMTQAFIDSQPEQELATGLWEPGRIAIECSNPVVWEPIAWKGQQGLYSVPASIIN